MRKVLWFIQVLLALLFLGAGLAKIIQPKDALAAIENMRWVEDFSQGTVRLIGTLELLAAIGLIVPALTRILPWLTPLAAAGLVLLMIGAAITHVGRGEYGAILVNLVILLVAAFVAYGRWRIAPIDARSPR